MRARYIRVKINTLPTMKKTLLLSFMMVLTIQQCLGQEIIPEALSLSKTNELGDPITNIVDADGAKQGEWFYQDNSGAPVLKQEYNNHTLISSSYPIVQLDGSIEWEESEEWTLNPKPGLENAIANSYGSFNANQQLILIFNSEGELIRYSPIGIWSKAKANELEIVVRNYLNSNQITFNDAAFILI